jgi:hypothetical protein
VTWLPIFLGQHYLILHTSERGSLTLAFSLLLSLLSFLIFSLIFSLISPEDAGSLVHAAVDHGVNLCVVRQQDRVDGKVWVVVGTRNGRLNEGMVVAWHRWWRRVLSRGSVHDWRVDQSRR